MRIFHMNTREGPTIPVLMTRPGVTVYDINTADLYLYVGHPLTSPNTPTPQKKGYAPPATTRDWFGASNNDLWMMLSSRAIGPAVNNMNRKLTLPSAKSYDRWVTIAPNARVVESFWGTGKFYELDNNISEPNPWTSSRREGVVFSPPITSENVSSEIYFDMSSQSQALYSIETRGQGYAGGLDVLIRDDNGNMGTLTLWLQEPYSWDDPGDIIDNVTCSTVYGGRTGSLPQDFWLEQTGTIEDTGGGEPPKGAGILDLSNRFSPRVETSALGIYPLIKEQVSDFIRDMWTTTFSEKILQTINGKPIDSVVSLKWYYGLANHITPTEKDAYVCIGNVIFDGSFGTSTTLITKPATTEFLTYSFGEINIPRYFNNFLDYSPFTEMELYIPYVGFVKLNITEFLGRKLRVEMNINIVTGVAQALVYKSTAPGQYQVVSMSKCSIGVDIPLSVDARESIESRFMAGMMGMGLSVAGAAVMASGPVGGVAGGFIAGQALGGAMNAIQVPQLASGDYRHSDGIDNESGSLGYLFPFVVITRPTPVAPPDYNEMVGKPDYRSGKVGAYNGYMKVGAIKQSNANIPVEAMNEIQQLLKDGVYSV